MAVTFRVFSTDTGKLIGGVSLDRMTAKRLYPSALAGNIEASELSPNARHHGKVWLAPAGIPDLCRLID
jgi:hypothetical protein